jgi:hypothetical protein
MRLAVSGVLLAALGACVPICGIGAKLSVTNARVDPSHNCPEPASNNPYDIHGTIDADNSTSNPVTIKSLSETNLTTAIHGNWTGALNEKGGGPITDFSPKTIGSGSSTTIKFSMPFECSDTGHPPVSTWGEFTFHFTVVTSAGTYQLDGANKHRLNI